MSVSNYYSLTSAKKASGSTSVFSLKQSLKHEEQRITSPSLKEYLTQHFFPHILHSKDAQEESIVNADKATDTANMIFFMLVTPYVVM